jgi:hypothetical protein
MHLENVNLPQLVRHIDSMVSNISGADRKRIIAIAIGRAVSISLQLPAQELTVDPNHHYDTTHTEAVNRIVSQLNEIYSLDVALVIDVARMYYSFRYNMVYNPLVFANLMDRIMVWSDDILPPRIKDLAQQSLARADFNSDVGRLVELAHLAINRA